MTENDCESVDLSVSARETLDLAKSQAKSAYKSVKSSQRFITYSSPISKRISSKDVLLKETIVRSILNRPDPADAKMATEDEHDGLSDDLQTEHSPIQEDTKEIQQEELKTPHSDPIFSCPDVMHKPKKSLEYADFSEMHELFDSPKANTILFSDQLGDIHSDAHQPVAITPKVSFVGIKEMMKTPKETSTAMVNGMKTLFKTPHVTEVVGNNFVGLKEMIKTPVVPEAVGNNFVGLKEMVKTPLAAPLLEQHFESGLFDDAAEVVIVKKRGRSSKKENALSKQAITELSGNDEEEVIVEKSAKPLDSAADCCIEENPKSISAVSFYGSNSAKKDISKDAMSPVHVKRGLAKPNASEPNNDLADVKKARGKPKKVTSGDEDLGEPIHDDLSNRPSRSKKSGKEEVVLSDIHEDDLAKEEESRKRRGRSKKISDEDKEEPVFNQLPEESKSSKRGRSKKIVGDELVQLDQSTNEESHEEDSKVRRGRPKKVNLMETAVDDANSEEMKAKRGRPKKAAPQQMKESVLDNQENVIDEHDASTKKVRNISKDPEILIETGIRRSSRRRV
jgi:hypothetical protein